MLIDKKNSQSKWIMFSNPFSFKGRISKLEYILSFFVALLYYTIPLGLDKVKMLNSFSAGLLLLPIVWFMIAQGTKRCHDTGKSGFYQVIPFINISTLFDDGHKEENEYGECPKKFSLKDLLGSK